MAWASTFLSNKRDGWGCRLGVRGFDGDIYQSFSYLMVQMEERGLHRLFRVAPNSGSYPWLDFDF